MSDATLRVGVAGIGVMGRHHLRALRDIDGLQVVGVVDPAGDPKGSTKGIDVLPNMEALLDRGLDMCIVASPTETHEELGLQLAAAGVHTLIEKPLAADVEGGARLVSAFKESGIIGCVGHIERYNAAIRSLHERLGSGELGDVYQIATRRQGPFPDRVRDVGVVKDLATHDLDLSAWVESSPYTWVSARTIARSGRPHEDLVVCVGSLESGTITNHLVNWLTPTKDRQVVVTGEKGCLAADMLAGDLTFYSNGHVPAVWDDISRFRGVTEGDVIRYALSKPEPLVVELEHFRDAVRGKDAAVVTLEEGLRTLQVAEAVLKSAELGVAVTVS